jgi:FkbM family methyltransferase
MLQLIKDRLVGLGPRSALVQAALKLHGSRCGFAIQFARGTISIRRRGREMVLGEKDFYLVPITLECFDQTFETVEPTARGVMSVLDFSAPGEHRYIRHGITLSFPGVPEDDSIEAYTHWYKPKPGDLIFDVGAHAGLTACMFARMVGPDGHVVAFEPDPVNAGWLEKNIQAQKISNAIVARAAIDSASGTAMFNADGTMGAGLVEHSVYGRTGRQLPVETLSLPDACAQFGMPNFVKMDVEGAEVGVIESAAGLLKEHPTNLAFDSYHRMRDGRFTWMLLEPMLRALGYDVASSAGFGQMFTWARPKGA